MCNLHRDNNDPVKLDEFLDSPNRVWRQACVTLFGCIDKAIFGGRYREQIYCACLPDCCYEKPINIF
ncbi:Hypothetical predicted protein [Mytilus galloprovincialis]|uniref:Uncharacterized protein n=1 Tax=Mytilus galloprovincialis TaxID=29158 RepID=A0A8B6FDX0_MYTGA|nr:Hypothetical predicted protein [Mytilus galloprovincialis]